MKNIFIVSDTHFFHTNIITYCKRPFVNVDEMDEALIENWNKVVRPQDKVYHLGDVYFHDKTKNVEHSVLKRLNGHKKLIVGNHDDLKDVHLHKYFEDIYMWRLLKEHNMLLTHVPAHASTLHAWPYLTDLLNVHGHIHDAKSPTDDRYFNACVEWHNYSPIPIEDVKL